MDQFIDTKSSCEKGINLKIILRAPSTKNTRKRMSVNRLLYRYENRVVEDESAQKFVNLYPKI